MWLSALALSAVVASGEPAKYLALGDSYTIGESVAEAERWPVVLAAQLRARGLALDPPRIIAKTGWTTDELSAAIDAATPQPGADHALVTLLIGVNNQYRGRPLDEYRAQFRALLERAIGFAGGRASRVVVVSIPDWGVTPFAKERDRAEIGERIDAFNAAAKAICGDRGVAFVDITGISRGEARAMVADDGLHPSGEQYTRWAAAVLPVAERALSTK